MALSAFSTLLPVATSMPLALHQVPLYGARIYTEYYNIHINI